MVETTVLISLFCAGLITGFSKFSVGGMGLLILPIVMLAFPGPEALGVIVPLYLITDFMAISSYRKAIAWPVLLRILPLAFIGVILGGKFLQEIDPEQFVLVLGLIIILMIALGVYLDFRPAKFMQKPITAYIMGLASGFISLVTNAAGPFVALFLLEQKLPKESYVSTRAWAFMFINLSKVPVLYSLSLINSDTLQAGMLAIPGLLIGSFLGHRFLKKVNPSQFKWLIRILAAVGAIKLFLFP